jgi:hypothetical protein
VSDVVGITSGLVTIGVARDQIAALAESIVNRLRRRQKAASASFKFSIEVSLPEGSAVLEGDSPEAARVLAKALQSVRWPE